MKEKVWWLGYQDLHSDRMKIINAKENFPKLIQEHKKFIWIFNFPENNLEWDGAIREIVPSWYEPKIITHRNKTKDFINLLPDGIVVLESIAENEIDFIIELGLPHEWIFELKENKPITPVILSFDKGWVYNTSVGRCYCLQTLIDFVVEIYPEKFTDLLEPTSIG